MKAHSGMSKEEFGEILKLAEEGNTEAQVEAAIACRHGWGTIADSQEALKWYLKAAENGDADAMCSVGHMYYIGDSGEQNLETAKNWCAKAVLNGCVQCAALTNEIYIAEAIGEGDLKQAKEQLETRKKVWNIPLTAAYTITINSLRVFFIKLQELLAEKLTGNVIPAHGDESLKKSPEGDFWYRIRTANENVPDVLFDYYIDSKPPFLVVAFYASMHGLSQEEAAPILEKYRNGYRCKFEGDKFGFAIMKEMIDEDFLEEKILEELSGEAVRLYETINKAQQELAGLPR